MSVLIIDWLEDCLKCGANGKHEVTTTYGGHGELYRGDTVKCGECGHTGVIEVAGKEDVWIEWDVKA